MDSREVLRRTRKLWRIEAQIDKAMGEKWLRELRIALDEIDFNDPGSRCHNALL
jgi:hypothetical protein